MARITKSERREIAVEVARLGLCIANGVYDAMENKNINKKEVARRVGVSTTYLQKLLDGDILLSLPMMVKISHALNFQWRVEKWSPKGGAR